VLPS
jgi:pentatricopeptide repeat protein